MCVSGGARRADNKTGRKISSAPSYATTGMDEIHRDRCQDRGSDVEMTLNKRTLNSKFTDNRQMFTSMAGYKIVRKGREARRNPKLTQYLNLYVCGRYTAGYVEMKH